MVTFEGGVFFWKGPTTFTLSLCVNLLTLKMFKQKHTYKNHVFVEHIRSYSILYLSELWFVLRLL